MKDWTFTVFGLCAGYVRRITHDEIADPIGEHSREMLGTPARLSAKAKGNNSLPRKRAGSENVVA